MRGMSGFLPMHVTAPAALPAPTTAWPALRRRLTEIATAAGGGTSYAAHVLLQAQRAGEIAAWVQPAGGGLYPPDLHEGGICLASLAVVHVPPDAGPFGVPRAGEILLRSGAYGLVVLDLAGGVPPAAAWQARLQALARLHDAAVLLLAPTPLAGPSLGAAVSWRLAPQRRRLAGGLFLLEAALLKNKAGQAWPLGPLARRPPWGME